MDVVESWQQTFCRCKAHTTEACELEFPDTMPVERTIRVLAMGVLLASALAVSGCSVNSKIRCEDDHSSVVIRAEVVICVDRKWAAHKRN